MCDGRPDCMNGEDEDDDICGSHAHSASSGDILQQHSSARTGRDMEMATFRVRI